MSLVRVSTLLLHEGFQQRLADTVERYLMAGFTLMHTVCIPTRAKHERADGSEIIVDGSGALVLVFLQTDLLASEDETNSSEHVGNVVSNPSVAVLDPTPVLEPSDVMNTEAIPSDVEPTGASAPPTEET